VGKLGAPVGWDATVTANHVVYGGEGDKYIPDEREYWDIEIRDDYSGRKRCTLRLERAEAILLADLLAEPAEAAHETELVELSGDDDESLPG
jgi:hypothetical protein